LGASTGPEAQAASASVATPEQKANLIDMGFPNPLMAEEIGAAAPTPPEAGRAITKQSA
jgi:hypothetical protein